MGTMAGRLVTILVAYWTLMPTYAAQSKAAVGENTTIADCGSGELQEYSGRLMIAVYRNATIKGVTRVGARRGVPALAISGVLHPIQLAPGASATPGDLTHVAAGALVSVKATRATANSTILHVCSYDHVVARPVNATAVQATSNAPARRELADQIGVPDDYKYLWFSIRHCGQGQTVEEYETVTKKVKGMWHKCNLRENTHNFKTGKSAHKVIDLGCDWPLNNCDSDLEAIRQHAIKNSGVDSNAYPHYIFAWPRWVSQNCWGGWARLGCNGHEGYTCQANVPYPHCNDPATVMHEIGHTLGLQDAAAAGGSCAAAKAPAAAWCTEGFRDDQTTPMGATGSGWGISCYNLPEQHLLGWTQPETLTEDDIGLKTWTKYEFRPLTRSGNAGLRIAVGNQQSVYIDWLMQEKGRGDMLPWLHDKLAIYTSGNPRTWNSNTIAMGTQPENYFKGLLVSTGDCLSVQDLRICREPRSVGANALEVAVVKVCRKASGQGC